MNRKPPPNEFNTAGPLSPTEMTARLRQISDAAREKLRREKRREEAMKARIADLEERMAEAENARDMLDDQIRDMQAFLHRFRNPDSEDISSLEEQIKQIGATSQPTDKPPSKKTG